MSIDTPARKSAKTSTRKKKLPLKQRYSLLTRDLDWEPSYVEKEKLFPYTSYEGIKVHDWDGWEDPFRLTVDAYYKYQAEKDKRLYAVLDGFAQSQGHLTLSDASYLNAIKLFIQGVTPLEYAAHRHFAYLGRYLEGPAPRFAALCQRVDELRHCQTQIHTISNYNKYYGGFHSWATQKDKVWYLSVPKSFFDDAMTAGPFEFLIAISFSFEYLLTNLLFVPFMSGASFNGDMPTMSFGFSAQSDESRHMTLGLEAIKFLLEQDEGNVPIIQEWIDKWFWRAYRVAALVAAMMDYMLPKEVMSWKEAFELYFEEQMMKGLFPDLRVLRHHPAATRRHRDRREGPHLAPDLQDPAQLLLRRRVHHPGADRGEDGMALRAIPGLVRRGLSPDLGAPPPHRSRGRASVRPGSPTAVPGLPDPDGLRRDR